jgi:hypothetical protein
VSFLSDPTPPPKRDRAGRPEPLQCTQTTFWSLHTTASLLLNFHNLLAEVRHNRIVIANGGYSQFDLDRRARQVQAAVDDITVIVAELRGRGHAVEWDE